MKQSDATPKNEPLNRRQAEALKLVFLDEQSDEEIARSLHTSRSTLLRWKALPEFQRQLDELHAKSLEAVRRESIAVRSNRISQLIDRSKRMRQLIQARAIEHADAAGGNTGLLVREIKSIGQGDKAQITETYKADTALLREMRETEKQIAIEVGEWSEKAEVHSYSFDMSKATDEQLARIAAGEDPAFVMATSSGGGTGTETATGPGFVN